MINARIRKLCRSRLPLLFVAASSVAAFCQTQTPAHPEFEVASIRLHSNADNRALVQALNGRLVITNFSLKQLILFAYGFPSNQVSGVRPWMDSGRYDLQATTEGGESVSQMEGPMLQALLEDRFNLKVHREMEERQVYELTIEKGGLKMQLSKPGSCAPYSMDSPPPPAPGAAHPNYCDFPHLAGDGTNWTLDGAGVSIAKLAGTLSRSGLDRPLIDKTGLTGGFDLHMKWAMDEAAGVAGPGALDNSNGVSMFTALREQLGLKLEASKGPVEILVIDRVEPPSAN